MNLFEPITLYKLTFQPFPILVVLVALVILYIVWDESQKDGFDEFRVFDLMFVLLSVSGGVSYGLIRLWGWQKTYNPMSPVLWVDFGVLCFAVNLMLVLLITRFFALRWNWSLYRLLDIFSFSSVATFSLVFAVFSGVTRSTIGLAVSAALLILSALLSWQGRRLISGTIFSSLCFALTLLITLFYQKNGGVLLAGAMLVIGFITLSFRVKLLLTKETVKEKLTMLNIDFIKKLKAVLLKKKVDIAHEQKILTEEDPYLKEGRAEDNSEAMDEAILEDAKKNEIDALQSDLSETAENVDKALGAIEKGTYGTCEVCGNPIDRARLKAIPETTLCFDCAEKRQS